MYKITKDKAYKQMIQQHNELLKTYQVHKDLGDKMEFYLFPDGSLHLYPYTSDEYKLLLKIYRKAGIW